MSTLDQSVFGSASRIATISWIAREGALARFGRHGRARAARRRGRMGHLAVHHHHRTAMRHRGRRRSPGRAPRPAQAGPSKAGDEKENADHETSSRATSAAQASPTGSSRIRFRPDDPLAARLDIVEELPRASLPGVAQRVFARRLARDRQRLEAGGAQVLVENARFRADDVDRPGDREGGDRQPARHRLDQHDAERVGAGREDEHVGARVNLRQRLAVPFAEEMGVRIAALERGARRPVADDDRRARKVEAEQRLEVLLHRDPADAEKDRPRQVERPLAARMEQGVIDAAAPQPDALEAAPRQLRARSSASAPSPPRRAHGNGAGPRRSAAREGRCARRCIRESACDSWW